MALADTAMTDQEKLYNIKDLVAYKNKTSLNALVPGIKSKPMPYSDEELNEDNDLNKNAAHLRTGKKEH